MTEKRNDYKNLLKDAGILLLITLLAGLLLGFVYELTKEPIRQQKEKRIQEACLTVFQAADSFRVIDYEQKLQTKEELAQSQVKIGTLYEALSDKGEVLGYVAEAISTKGYGGNIVLYMGVRLDGTLNAISLLEIKETPGLGMQAEKVLVPQFQNKNVKQFSYTKEGSRGDSEIDAISGATVTTKAITNAVNGGLKVVQDLIGGDAR